VTEGSPDKPPVNIRKWDSEAILGNFFLPKEGIVNPEAAQTFQKPRERPGKSSGKTS
jgi:hypothetical protein